MNFPKMYQFYTPKRLEILSKLPPFDLDSKAAPSCLLHIFELIFALTMHIQLITHSFTSQNSN